MKQRLRDMVAGFMVAVLLSSITVWAATGTQNITITYRNIKLYIDGVLITPKDPNGNVVEPFIYNGTTYLPIRAVGEAFGKEVHWDGDTSSVYVGQVPGKPLREVPLYNKPYIDIGNAARFNASGNDRENHITFSFRGSDTNYVVYPLNTLAASFKATLLPISGSGDTATYRIYGDDRLLYTSPSIGSGTPPIPIEVDVSGVMQLKIEIEYYVSIIHSSARIENAVIITTDY